MWERLPFETDKVVCHVSTLYLREIVLGRDPVLCSLCRDLHVY